MASAAERLLYFDASALIKLIVREPESAALRQALDGAVVASSELVLAEVPRAIRRLLSGRRAAEWRGLEGQLRAVLERVRYVPVERRLLVRAGAFAEAYLRILDAIHLASALDLVPELDAFVSYDERQLEAAAVADLELLSPR